MRTNAFTERGRYAEMGVCTTEAMARKWQTTAATTSGSSTQRAF